MKCTERCDEIWKSEITILYPQWIHSFEPCIIVIETCRKWWEYVGSEKQRISNWNLKALLKCCWSCKCCWHCSLNCRYRWNVCKKSNSHTQCFKQRINGKRWQKSQPWHSMGLWWGSMMCLLQVQRPWTETHDRKQTVSITRKITK